MIENKKFINIRTGKIANKTARALKFCLDYKKEE